MEEYRREFIKGVEEAVPLPVDPTDWQKPKHTKKQYRAFDTLTTKDIFNSADPQTWQPVKSEVLKLGEKREMVKIVPKKRDRDSGADIMDAEYLMNSA